MYFHTDGFNIDSGKYFCTFPSHVLLRIWSMQWAHLHGAHAARLALVPRSSWPHFRYNHRRIWNWLILVLLGLLSYCQSRWLGGDWWPLSWQCQWARTPNATLLGPKQYRYGFTSFAANLPRPRWVKCQRSLSLSWKDFPKGQCFLKK